MNPLSTETTSTTTFVVRFWHEWSVGKPRWRGRVEHVESGRQAYFLKIEDLVCFLEGFGIDLQGQGPLAPEEANDRKG